MLNLLKPSESRFREEKFLGSHFLTLILRIRYQRIIKFLSTACISLAAIKFGILITGVILLSNCVCVTENCIFCNIALPSNCSHYTEFHLGGVVTVEVYPVFQGKAGIYV